MVGQHRTGGLRWSSRLATACGLALVALAVFGDATWRSVVAVIASPVLMGALTLTTIDLVRLPHLGAAERRAWRTMLVAFSLFLLNGLAGVGMRLTGVDLGPQRQLAVTAGMLVMTGALFLFPAAPTRRLPRVRFLLDGLTIFAATSVFLWRFVLAPELAAGHLDRRLALLVVLVVGCLTVLVVALALLLLRERTPGTREALVRLVIAVAIVLGLMLVAINRGLSSTAAPDLWRMALNWTSVLLVMSAAEQQRRRALLPEDEPMANEAPALQSLPHVAAALVFGLLLWLGFTEASPMLRWVLVGGSSVAGCVLARQWLLLRENDHLRQQLELQARHDALTGLLNRTSWEAEAEREVAKALRAARPLSVLMLDADEFKKVNDHHGHAAGDEVLRAIAECLRVALRRSDVAARLGGDEFVVLLPETALEDATHLAEALCMRLARTRVDVGDVTLRLTVSVGAATLPPARGLRELLADADEALYRAKRAGRNRVEPAVLMRALPPLQRQPAGERWA